MATRTHQDGRPTTDAPGPGDPATGGEAPADLIHGPVPVPPAAPRDPVAELRFLHEILRLATTARTWEELLETVVDGTRDALHASVSSLYLLDRDGERLTLAATNGLDRHHIGRAVVPIGRGHHRPRRRQPAAHRDPRRPRGRPVPVGPRPRPAPLRGVDAVGAVDLARPGRRRPQRPDRGPSRVHDRRRGAAVRDRGPSGRDRREGAAAARGRGAGRPAHGPRPGALGADRARHPRAAHATRRRPRLHGPARGGARARRPLVTRPRAASDPRGLARGNARAGGAAGPAGGLDPRIGPGGARPAGRPPDARPP